jgi:hypothetical protein
MKFPDVAVITEDPGRGPFLHPPSTLIETIRWTLLGTSDISASSALTRMFVLQTMQLSNPELSSEEAEHFGYGPT